LRAEEVIRQHIALNDSVIDERWTGKDLEGNDRSLLEELFWRLAAGSDKIHEQTSVRIAGVSSEIRTGHLHDKCQMHYQYTNTCF
jgi:hypothetical protein